MAQQQADILLKYESVIPYQTEMIHICALSDTHKKYNDIHLEPGDLLIFAGDIF